MLVLDKARALDRMVWLADRKGNTPPEFLRPSPLRWSVEAGGRRALAGEVVLRVAPAVSAPDGALPLVTSMSLGGAMVTLAEPEMDAFAS